MEGAGVCGGRGQVIGGSTRMPVDSETLGSFATSFNFRVVMTAVFLARGGYSPNKRPSVTFFIERKQKIQIRRRYRPAGRTLRELGQNLAGAGLFVS